MKKLIESTNQIVHTQDNSVDLEIVSLGKATELTKGSWGMWWEAAGEMARS